MNDKTVLPYDRLLTAEEHIYAEKVARDVQSPYRDVRPDIKDLATAYLDMRSREREVAEINRRAEAREQSEVEPDADEDGYCTSCGERHKGEPHPGAQSVALPDMKAWLRGKLRDHRLRHDDAICSASCVNDDVELAAEIQREFESNAKPTFQASGVVSAKDAEAGAYYEEKSYVDLDRLRPILADLQNGCYSDAESSLEAICRGE